jgi:LPXTG-motif cell wall-anchored protein
MNDENCSIIDNMATSSIETVANRNFLECVNYCSDANSNELRIIKKMKEGQSTEDKFTFKVYLGEDKETKEPIPYVGEYFLMTKDGSYYDHETDSKGMIKDVSVGDTVIIKQILAGTSYKVEEEQLNTNYFKLNPFVGIIEYGKDVTIEAINRYITNSITILKKGYEKGGSISPLNGAKFKIYNKSDKSSEQIKVSEDGKLEFDNLKDGKYIIEEVDAPNGYFTLSEPIEVSIKNGILTSTSNLLVEINSENKVVYLDGIRIAKELENGTYNYEITIFNNLIYELPSSGGSGTYLFTISGVAILMTVFLIVMQDRKRRLKEE